MLVYGKCECFVMQMLYVCVLCASCSSSQFCVVHDLQFVNAGRGCKKRPYGRGILQSWSHNCLVGSHECLFCLPHPVAVSAFVICSGLCACTEMLWMCVLYVSFGSKVRPPHPNSLAAYTHATKTTMHASQSPQQPHP